MIDATTQEVISMAWQLTPTEQKEWAQAQLSEALKEEQQAQGALSLAQSEVRRCREKLLEFVE